MLALSCCAVGNITMLECLEPILCTTCFYWLPLNDSVCVLICVCVHREQVQRSEESSPSLAASLRHQSMKQSPSQHSFDSAILEGSLPDENLSVDSDISENFVVLMDSGTQNASKFPKQFLQITQATSTVSLSHASRVRYGVGASQQHSSRQQGQPSSRDRRRFIS